MNKFELSLGQNKNPNEDGELSLEEKSIVERIEKMDADDHSKALLILTWKGLKPVSEFDFKHYDVADDPARLEHRREMEALVADMGLYAHREEDKLDGQRYDKKGEATPVIFYRDSYAVAKNKEDLKYFVVHFGKEENYETTKRLGEILGYPETAIEAWNTTDRSSTLLKTKIENPELYARDEMAFAKFRLSKEHWVKEFETIKNWANEIKHIDPNLYERIVENRRRILANE